MKRQNRGRGFWRMLVIALAMALCVSIGATAANTRRLPGDMDRDGEITPADARTVLRIAVKLDSVENYMDDDSQTPEEPSQPVTEKPDQAPSTKAEILDFYKSAVARVKNNGEAGYSKKEWQTVGNLNVTGIGMVDNAIADTVSGYVTGEEDAEVQVFPKGSDEAGNHFPPFTLTDYSKVASAACAEANGNYRITIIMQDEDTPSAGSFLQEVTDSVLLWEDVEKEIITNVGIVKDFSDVHIIYRGFKIEAEITPDGRFVTLDQTAHVDIRIGSAKVLIATIKNKRGSMDTYLQLRDFRY